VVTEIFVLRLFFPPEKPEMSLTPESGGAGNKAFFVHCFDDFIIFGGNAFLPPPPHFHPTGNPSPSSFLLSSY
jgi:hypothetical protein